ncbi:phospholipid carrier-dependent glycosyltransferase [Paucibacter sp. AS339]|uniref:ArnT family glycosyltransferase n=1 Tax=Paucibacter hankyongi TaxID=3133434 RepID=UPI0030AABDF2
MDEQSARPPTSNWTNVELVRLLGIAIFAGVLRWLLFAGFQGSDEVTYLGAALGVLEGRWPTSTYIGSLRYGINIPMAAGIAVFGLSESGAAAWGFLCSVGEVAVVYLAARQVGGQRAALFSALILAMLPLHVHEATRMIGDPSLSFFITLGFFSVWLGENNSQKKWYFWAGISFGAAYWIKDAVFYISILSGASYILITRRFHWNWLLLAMGSILVVFLNTALMQELHGNWLHLFSISKNTISRVESTTNSFFYFKYLLADFRHFWIVPFLTLGGILSSLPKQQVNKNSVRLYGIWLVAFLVILSALPLRQVNYLLLIAAPLAIFAGIFLAGLKSGYAVNLTVLTLVGSLLLAALQQQSLHKFTANSRATVDFAERNLDAQVFAGTGGFRADIYFQHLNGRGTPTNRAPVKGLPDFDRLNAAKALNANIPTFVIQDPETFGWGDKADSAWSERTKNSCMKMVGSLEPVSLGIGHYVSDLLIALSEKISKPINKKLIGLLRPEKATVYQLSQCPSVSPP